jgi:hypothetical protein
VIIPEGVRRRLLRPFAKPLAVSCTNEAIYRLEIHPGDCVRIIGEC